MKYFLLLFVSALFTYLLMSIGIGVDNILFWIATFVINWIVYYILFEYDVDNKE